jgi:nitrogen fixation/metabolism regulation signal transduction histidine kinase
LDARGAIVPRDNILTGTFRFSEIGTNIFDPFFTTKSSGMGLGLAISRRIIEDHGGDLRLVKTDSDGCTFEITLPSVVTSDSGLRRAHEASV